jgi:hypothetical protein
MRRFTFPSVVSPAVPHYHINGTIFGKKEYCAKNVCFFYFIYKFIWDIFHFLSRIQRDIVINVKTSSCKVSVIIVGF